MRQTKKQPNFLQHELNDIVKNKNIEGLKTFLVNNKRQTHQILRSCILYCDTNAPISSWFEGIEIIIESLKETGNISLNRATNIHTGDTIIMDVMDQLIYMIP